jgi:hypothetical protein
VRDGQGRLAVAAVDRVHGAIGSGDLLSIETIERGGQ